MKKNAAILFLIVCVTLGVIQENTMNRIEPRRERFLPFDISSFEYSKKDKGRVALMQVDEAVLQQCFEYGGIPSVILAQIRAESVTPAGRWTKIAEEGKNPFNHKAFNWKGEVMLQQDDEEGKSKFRVYPSLDSAIHSHIIWTTNGRYKESYLKAIRSGDHRKAYKIATAGLERYATRENYAGLLRSVIERHNLQKLDSSFFACRDFWKFDIPKEVEENKVEQKTRKKPERIVLDGKKKITIIIE